MHFYTGLTRAKRLAIAKRCCQGQIVVGSKKAITLVLRSTEKQQRYTQLAKKL